MKRFYAIVAMLICFCMAVPAMADILVLPGNLKVIGEEAFRGNTSLSEVVLPEGVEEIGERAFAESGLTKINLPDSLVSIADNAFDSPVDIEFVANEGTVADEWINSHHDVADTIRDGHVCQTRTVLERVPFNADNTIRYGHTRQTRTVGECVSSNDFDTIWDDILPG